jgi:fructose-1,6-bisphosphatase I
MIKHRATKRWREKNKEAYQETREEPSVTEPVTLEAYLNRRPDSVAVARTILELAGAGREIARILARGKLAGDLSAVIGDSRDGDGQKALDALTHTIIRDALAAAPVALFASEEADAPEVLNPGGKLAVAVDPLDGSSNIDTLAPVGTIFSILPMQGDNPLLQPGRNQLAAGFLIYGPQTALALTLGDSTDMFTLDPRTGTYLKTRRKIKVPHSTREYAINASNARHWDPEIRLYINELLQGRDGPRGEDFNTRWLASMVGDAYRILTRGGIYLYPGDHRRGYRHGRLRLIYEANPVAMLMEHAGAAATDGRMPILDIIPTDIHQRIPLIFGATDEVKRVAEAYDHKAVNDPPLFKKRSLFRVTGDVAGLA